MSMLDALIAEIQAAPDDDAPRLAWANIVGGERGELVAVQCRLASGPLTDRDEWRRLRARERELLFAHGIEWSGLAGEYPSSCTFRRGFVESAGFVCSHDSRLDGILARLPLARSMSNDVVNQDDYDFAKLVANPRSSALAALRIDGDRTIQRLVDQGVVPRALDLSRCSRASAKLLAESGLLAKVDRLVLRSVEDIGVILSATTRLRALSIDALATCAAEIPLSVVELACNGGLGDVAKLSIAPTLQRLRVSDDEFTWDFEPLMSFEALRSLDLSRVNPGDAYRPIVVKGQRVLPALRELSLSWRFEEDSVESAAKAFGSQLDTLHWSGSIGMRSGLTRHYEKRWLSMGMPVAGIREMQKPLVVGGAHIGAHVDGEYIVGFGVPWGRRPLEFGDDGRGPWFEGGGVTVSR